MKLRARIHHLFSAALNIAEHHGLNLSLELREESTGPHRVYMVVMRRTKPNTEDPPTAAVTDWMRGRDARVWMEGFHTAIVLWGNKQ